MRTIALSTLALLLACEPPQYDTPDAGPQSDSGESEVGEATAELREAGDEARTLGVHFYRTWAGDNGQELVMYDEQERQLGRALFLSLNPVDAVASSGIGVRLSRDTEATDDGMPTLIVTVDGRSIDVSSGELADSDRTLLEYYSVDISQVLVLGTVLFERTLQVDESPVPPAPSDSTCRAGRADVSVVRTGFGHRSNIEARADSRRNTLCATAGGCCAKGSSATLNGNPANLVPGLDSEWGFWVIRSWGTVPGNGSLCGTIPPCPGGRWCGQVSNRCGRYRNCGCQDAFVCASNQCRPPPGANCRGTCPNQYECGSWRNECGVTIRCGTCSNGRNCVGRQCVRGSEGRREDEEEDDEEAEEQEDEEQNENAREEYNNDSDDDPGNRPCAPGTSRPYPGARCI